MNTLLKTSLLPALSEYDPALSSEGSIDPLGLYSIADALGVRLVPGVRERQGYPRFLTAMAVAAVVCEPFDDETVAADDVSEPWQVFEWYVVEGLVRTAKQDNEIQGLPGREKARTAIRNRLPLSADRYLKTPTVFGFHGVYRLLSRTLGVERAGRLGEFGYELVRTWSEEQGIPGFFGSETGEGRRRKNLLFDAVKDGLKRGRVARGGGWSGWQFIHDRLGPHDIGRREAILIRNALLQSDEGFRRKILKALVSPEGQALWRDTASEREFHQWLFKGADGEVYKLLKAIMTYESFSRLLQDAFDDCRYIMSNRTGKTLAAELAETAGVMTAAEHIHGLAKRLMVELEPFGESIRFEATFGWTLEPLPARQWVDRLLEHHVGVQHRKPPAGKAPWIEQLDAGGYLIRPAYRVDKAGRHDSSYVHAYRTNPLWSFAEDLRWVK